VRRDDEAGSLTTENAGLHATADNLPYQTVILATNRHTFTECGGQPIVASQNVVDG